MATRKRRNCTTSLSRRERVTGSQPMMVSRSWICHAAAHQTSTATVPCDHQLAEPVAGLSPDAGLMFFVEQGVGDLPVGGGGGGADVLRGAGIRIE